MGKITYQNLPSTATPLNASNLNTMQDIISSGSNTNGSWVKYDDGTMICYMLRPVVGTFHTNQTWGNMWESDQIDLGSFPQTFIATPAIQLTNQSGSGGFFETLENPSTTAVGKTYICRPVSTNSGFNYTVSIIAIGKWK